MIRVNITIVQDSGLILGLRPANERRRYFVTTSLIGWAQTQNQPWNWFQRVTPFNSSPLVRNGRKMLSFKCNFINEN